MKLLELLAPARDKNIGIAAIDCGADAVYIAGPALGNRKAAGNSIEDIAELCAYAHRFGVRVYMTVNTIIYGEPSEGGSVAAGGEWEMAHEMMLTAQDAGVDAFIFREEKLLEFKDIHIPMHASTQCSIRTVERARHFDSLGCARIILERGLSLEELRQICAAVSCEVEFFVHGALCVCYSGECRLSEYLDGRSADRGDCIQACRSQYDLVDGSGRTIVHDKALLSLKDFKLLDSLEELADAGVCSFKIEGRLKNESYVRNVVREYSLALDSLVQRRSGEYRRASWGKVSGGFTPNSDKTFNRGYTRWWLDGVRGSWSCMDAPKAMGEFVGTVSDVMNGGTTVKVRPAHPGIAFSSGDGFAFICESPARRGRPQDRAAAKRGNQIRGFRGDRCEGTKIECKRVEGLRPGVRLYRNADMAFEKQIAAQAPRREITVELDISVRGAFTIELKAHTEDGREVLSSFSGDVESAQNRERAEAMLREQLGKRAGIYAFSVRSFDASGPLPLLSASTINSMRRLLAEDIDATAESSMRGSRPRDAENAPLSRPEGSRGSGFDNTRDNGFDGSRGSGADTGAEEGVTAASSGIRRPLMRTKYCIRFELGMCPKYQGAKAPGPLYLVNNGRRLALHFDCGRCEMTVDLPADI